MEDTASDDYLVAGISPEPGALRWALIHPELRFQVGDARNLTFRMEFVIAEATFKATGPVTVSCAINGKTLGSIRCDRAGDYRWNMPVPEGWVAPGPVRVTFEAEPRWTSPEDGAQLSFLLRSAGFTQ
jgi:hypothetical protein